MESFKGGSPAGLPEIDFVCFLAAQKVEPIVVGYSKPEFHEKWCVCSAKHRKMSRSFCKIRQLLQALSGEFGFSDPREVVDHWKLELNLMP